MKKKKQALNLNNLLKNSSYIYSRDRDHIPVTSIRYCLVKSISLCIVLRVSSSWSLKGCISNLFWNTRGLSGVWCTHMHSHCITICYSFGINLVWFNTMRTYMLWSKWLVISHIEVSYWQCLQLKLDSVGYGGGSWGWSRRFDESMRKRKTIECQ